MYDLLIKNGRVIDGTGNGWFKADVAVVGDRIVRVGKAEGESRSTIDASGMVVAPGFINVHGHLDCEVLSDPRCECALLQGMTSEVAGQCGQTLAPLYPKGKHHIRRYMEYLTMGARLDWEWESVGDFLSRIETSGVGVNFGTLVGHGTIRLNVMGTDYSRPATSEEIGQMKTILEKALEDGALGLSSGLVYPPGSFATTDELVALCEVVAKHGGYYSTHIRNEGDKVVEAVSEAIEIGRRAGCRVQIAHVKAAGRDNWGKMDAILDMVEKAREEGVDVACDQYLYDAGITMLRATLPPWALEGGLEAVVERLKDPSVRERIVKDIEAPGPSDWENMVKYCGGFDGVVVAYCDNKSWEGKSVAQIARELGISEHDALFHVLIEEQASPMALYFTMSEENIRKGVANPYVIPVRDNVPDLGVGKPHPRIYGTFPRLFGRYVREQRVLRLEEAVRKVTSAAAQRAGLKDRGLIREGLYADIVVFDDGSIIDRATYAEPRQHGEGIAYVVVNGKVAVSGGRITGVLSGMTLRL